MPLMLVDENVVVAAGVFNPSVVGQHWLVKHEIVGEEEFEQGCVFTDVLVQVQTKAFMLAIVPPRLQFAPRVDDDRQQSLIIDKVGGIVKAIPHTPYVACGLNFTWQLKPECVDVASLCRRIFFREGDPLYAFFDDGQPLFGGYFSRDALGCRIKLDVKPVDVKGSRVEDGKTIEEEWRSLQFAFNFHDDLSNEQNSVQRIAEMFHRWNDAKTMALAILNRATDRDRS
jgi:hypothetical protein